MAGKGKTEETLADRKQEVSNGVSTGSGEGELKKKAKKRTAVVKGETEEEDKRESTQQRETKETEDTLLTKKKKKIKEEPQTCDDLGTVVFLSEKTGNADEVTIDQERRMALQREIDQESQPKRLALQSGLGQWSTAQFDNSDQQQKFLRLMGGCKKGAPPMVAGGGGRANMALGKVEQQKLQQGLQGEFERAQARRVDFNSKGLGLGFSALSNKKFAIDINACKSVRFDD
ncbi:lysine-rich nucleolar protein 1 [Aplochiton taeniatus]